jgi:ornithine decarboxylase
MMINRRLLKKLAEEHGTPLFVVDHDELRATTPQFKKYLPRVQAYYAVKANPDPAIVKTLLRGRARASTWPRCRSSASSTKHQGPADKERQDWIWDKIIYANPIKANETLQEA